MKLHKLMCKRTSAFMKEGQSIILLAEEQIPWNVHFDAQYIKFVQPSDKYRMILVEGGGGNWYVSWFLVIVLGSKPLLLVLTVGGIMVPLPHAIVLFFVQIYYVEWADFFFFVFCSGLPYLCPSISTLTIFQVKDKQREIREDAPKKMWQIEN